jgi:hypothetical protein
MEQEHFMFPVDEEQGGVPAHFLKIGPGRNMSILRNNRFSPRVVVGLFVGRKPRTAF